MLQPCSENQALVHSIIYFYLTLNVVICSPRNCLYRHPDRWVGLSQYAVAVQAAFELVTEAYEHLSAQLDYIISLQTAFIEARDKQNKNIETDVFY